MQNPLVSVIIPCYNRAQYLPETIESALAQTYPNLEIIAVDDGSTDDTSAVLASYSDRISIITQANAGSSAARNAGIAASKGEYLAWLDSDDAWLPDKAARQIAVMNRWPEAGLAHTGCIIVDEQGQPVSADQPPVGDKLEEDALERMIVDCYPNTSSCLVRREVLEQIGPFDARWTFAEDWEFCLRLAERYPFAYTGGALTRYRMHVQSKTADRLTHTVGQVRLRQAIEDRKAAWLAARDTPGLRRALARHTHEFAHVYGRLGLIYQKQGDARRARDAFRNAMRLEPGVLKHRVRYLRMAMAAARQPVRPETGVAS